MWICKFRRVPFYLGARGTEWVKKIFNKNKNKSLWNLYYLASD